MYSRTGHPEAIDALFEDPDLATLHYDFDVPWQTQFDEDGFIIPELTDVEPPLLDSNDEND